MMGYRIIYGKDKCRYRQRTKGKKMLVVGIVAVLLLIAFCCFGGGRLLLPGDPEVSGAALENMVDAVQDGERFSDAIVTFCQEIIANAKTQQ